MSISRVLAISVLILLAHAMLPGKALSQDSVAGLNEKFKKDHQARTNTPEWKKLEQTVTTTLGLSKLGAASAEKVTQQRIINAQLETPRETAKYLSDLAFNGSKGTEGASTILIEITTNPTAVAQARQLIPQQAQARVNSLLDTPQLRRLSSSSLNINVPEPGKRPDATAPGREKALPPAAGAAKKNSADAQTSPQKSGNTPEAKAQQPAQKVTAASPTGRPALPPGYEPVKGGSSGCAVR